MKGFLKEIHTLRDFLILWLTQALSQLGSAMSDYALILWSYRQTGSALSTALLSVCLYAPYVAVSVFAGALSDRWDKRRTMLVCDSLAAAGTAAALLLHEAGGLRIGYIYLLNALSGLMNSVQQPASEVAATLLVPREQYQRASGLRSLSGPLVTILTPVCGSALMGLFGLRIVLLVDLATFAVAACALLFFVRVPQAAEKPRETVLQAARAGMAYLKRERGVLHLMLFLAAVNLTASIYEAALPAMMLSRTGGGEAAYGVLRTTDGRCAACGKFGRRGGPGLEKPGARDLQYAADFHEHGKLFPCVWAQLAGVVCGHGTGVERYSADEREPGRAAARPHSGGNAGTRVFRAQYVSVFYDSDRICAWRRAGGSCV